MKLTTKQSKGFTLVELLVVIAIIAVLATLAAPAVLGALKKSKIAKSTGVCTAFEVAVNNFESEYNYLPFSGSGSAPNTDLIDNNTTKNDDLVAVLAGRENEINFKEIKFFELGEPKGSKESNYKDGMHIDGNNAKLYDPWGEKYYISMDYDLDGEIENPFDTDQVHGKNCLMWSTGPDKKTGSTQLDRDNPNNFE